MDNKPLLIPNPELDATEAFDAGMLLLNQARALLEVHAPGCEGSLNLASYESDIVAEYVAGAQTLLEAGIDCMMDSTSKDRKKGGRHG